MTSSIVGELPKQSSAPDLRVPVIFTIYQSESRANGGIESISRIVESLSRFRAVIITQRETAVTARWRRLGLEVHVWDIPDPRPIENSVARLAFQSRRVLPLLNANRRIARLVERTRARVVHCNDILSFWHAAPGAIAAGARIVFNIRDVLPSDVQYGIKWRATRLIADELVALSREMRGHLEERVQPLLPSSLVRPRAIRSIYSMVDSSRLCPVTGAERRILRESLGIHPDEFAIGYVGSFCKKKNQRDYIEQGLTKLRKLVPHAVTYFLGDFSPEEDDYSQQCASLVASAGLSDRVRFVGFTESMLQWYRALDLICIASRNEGLARSMIESLACGTPVVSFDVCSAREILAQHGCGRVVPQGDYLALVEAIAGLASNANERAAMSTVGASVAKQLFHPEQIRASYEDLYARLGAPARERDGGVTVS